MGERPLPSWLIQTWQILVKDLLLGWRTRAKVVAMVVFAGTMLLLFSFAIGPNNTLLAKHAAGYVWLSALLSSTLLLSQSFQVEESLGLWKDCSSCRSIPAPSSTEKPLQTGWC